MELHNQLFSTYRKITEPLSQRHLQLISEIARALETRNPPRKNTRKVWKKPLHGSVGTSLPSLLNLGKTGSAKHFGGAGPGARSPLCYTVL